MAGVRKYRVTQNGYETIMKLNDEDVKNYPGAEPVEGESADVDEAGDQADADGADDTSKARKAVNKSRTAANK